MDKINSMRSRKMTLLFVSHSIGQVKKICEKAVFIENGTVIAEGESQKVCDLYLNQSTNGSEKEKIKALEKAQNENGDILQMSSNLDANKFFRINQDFNKQYTEKSGGGELEFLSLDIYDENNNLLTEITSMSNIKIVASCISNENIQEGFVVGLLCRDQNGNDMFACNSNHYNIAFDSIKSGTKFIVEWAFNFPLLHGIDGIYTFSLGAKPEPMSDYFYDRIFNALVVKVNNPLGFEYVGGLCYVKPKINIYKKEN